MATDSHKAAFAAAAAAAQELIAGKTAQRAKLAAQLDGIDAEIARLQVMIDFALPAKPPALIAKREKKNWVAAIGEVLIQFPQGLVFNDLVEQLRSKRGYDHSKDHIQKLLDSGEKKGALRRDEERRWHVVKNFAPSVNGSRKSPWQQLPGASA